jgi:hypothetical protein
LTPVVHELFRFAEEIEDCDISPNYIEAVAKGAGHNPRFWRRRYMHLARGAIRDGRPYRVTYLSKTFS